MLMKTKLFLSLLAVLGVAAALIFLKGRGQSPKSGAVEPSGGSATEAALTTKPTPDDKRLIVGFSFNKPPYTIVGQGEVVDPYAPGARAYGIEPDLFKAAIANTGKTFTLHSETLSRIALDVYNGTIDAAAISMNEPRRPGVYYSKEFLAFQNVVVTRKAANLKIEKLSDLRGHSVSAWQGASIQHSSDYFENLVKDNPNYFESTDQAAQYRMFAEHHVDALVIDKYIFLWWYKQDPRREEFVFHLVLPPNPFCIGFRDPVLRDAFNEGLDRIAASGERDKIFNKYFAEVLPAPPPASQNP
jgi:polar amino acid transport system substrate-binding protein